MNPGGVYHAIKRMRPWSKKTFTEGGSMNWEPWTGCYKASDGCTYCYFYGPYAKRYGQNIIEKTDKFDWLSGGMQRDSTTSKETKFSQPALQLTFSFPRQMNGVKKFGP